MTLLFIDGYDHYSDLTKKNYAITNYGGITTGHNGNGGYVGANYVAGNDGAVTRNIPANTEIVIGMAVNFGDLQAEAYWQLREGASIVHLEMRRNGSGFLEFRRGSGGTLIGTTTSAVAGSTWAYLEVKLKVHDSTGTLEVRINDVVQFTFSGDTRNGGTVGQIDGITWGALRIFATGFEHDWYWDDLYICDVAGSVNNNFLGECKVETKFPNGNGNSSQFVGSDADSTDNYLLVDEATPNDDTDYVESSTVGEKDTYAMQNVATIPATIHGVQVNVHAKKTDAGARKIVSVARLSGGTEEDSAEHVLTTGYVNYRDIRETKPGGGAWTTGDIDSSEFGVKVTA